MKTKILTAVVLSGVVMAAGALSAQPAPGEMPERPDFATLDVDADGNLTMEELQARADQRFADMDTDGDGALSAEELVAKRVADAEARVARMITRLDANEDGILQMEELQPRGGARFERMFERMDADQDGVLSEEEFAAVQERMMDRRGDRGEHGRGWGHGPRGKH
ncbi:EF-hand domain-containing protein [Loktanella sp. S4079]|uniref:EF-hand domain-containing protein n=1 Tax=Loktanella sp. S4079 TaxID=579483 RepID=UPI0005F9D887|nr:EF-hand domain-containing protein [Loktanella sp. S4079]KJZ19680.1 hypothetical protein TW80_01915 [Loktanella sp. S4079]